MEKNGAIAGILMRGIRPILATGAPFPPIGTPCDSSAPRRGSPRKPFRNTPKTGRIPETGKLPREGVKHEPARLCGGKPPRKNYRNIAKVYAKRAGAPAGLGRTDGTLAPTRIIPNRSIPNEAGFFIHNPATFGLGFLWAQGRIHTRILAGVHGAGRPGSTPARCHSSILAARCRRGPATSSTARGNL